MGADSRGTAPPVAFAGGVLAKYRHVCAFVDDRAPLDSVLDPFVRDSVESGDRLLYLVDSGAPAQPFGRLRRLGYDPAALVRHGLCEVRTWEETYLRTGGFDQVDMLGLLDGMLGTGERPRIRLVADMGWAAQEDGVTGSLIEFEARANFLHARHEHVVICAYDTSRFDGAFIVDILRTHPMVLIGGLLQENPFFIPPSDFLREHAGE